MASVLPPNTPYPSSSSEFSSTLANSPSLVATVGKKMSTFKGEIVARDMMDFYGKRARWSTDFVSPDHAVDTPAPSEKKEIRPRTVYRSGLTPEKARLLRKELRAAEVWHKDMYHSAIASRLACLDQ